jgi:hypothetical protein
LFRDPDATQLELTSLTVGLFTALTTIVAFSSLVIQPVMDFGTSYKLKPRESRDY